MRGNGFDPFGLIHLTAMEPLLGENYLVKDLVSARSITVLYGESGSGKTFLALHLALCVAGAAEFFERRVRQAGVIYVAAEAGRSIQNRVAAAKIENALQWSDTVPFAAITTPLDMCSQHSIDTRRLISTAHHASLGLPVELIVIDTLSRVMAGGNENQPDDMGALVNNIDLLREETGAAILLVHHTGKDQSRGARGHSLLRAAIDTEIEVSHERDNPIIQASVTKQRDYGTDGLLSFKLRRIELGEDSDGDPVTSCVVEPLPAEPRRKSPKPPSGIAKLGLEQLKNCLADQSVDLPISPNIPRGFKGVTLEAWKQRLLGAAIINLDGNHREQFKRIRVTLQSAEIIGVWSDFVWLSQRVT